MNLSTLLRTQAKVAPEKVFVFFERQSGKDFSEPYQRQLTYEEFDQTVDKSVEFLRKQGVKPGQVYNLHLPNCLSFLFLWFAGARLGAVMMPTNVLASVDELKFLLRHSDSVISFTTCKYMDVVKQAIGKTESIKTVLCDPFTIDPTNSSFEYYLEKRKGKFTELATDVVIQPDQMAAIMYTSGTTSKPKGVMVSHANYIKAGQTVAEAIQVTTKDRLYIVLPLFHGNAQYYSTMSALVSGASIVLMDRFSASGFMSRCRFYNATVASLFAAPMRMILAQGKQPMESDNKLRVTIFAQSMTEEQLQEWQARFSSPLCQLWGMTETMGPPLMNPLFGELRNQSIGKAIGGYEVRLVDGRDEFLDGPGSGQIVVKGESKGALMQGYFKNPEATRETLKNGWLYTGDRAQCDEQGYFHFIDRIKDMIKRSGENISAGEVELVLLQHPAVFECAVIGMPDEIRDEEVVAAIVLSEECKSTENELIKFCASHLARFRVPGRIVFVSDLPKTSVGKIQKHILREALTSKV